MEGKYFRWVKALGPGLLFAGAAIGVSHLVQSTRAGAEYGFALVLFVLLANLFKYPFFEFGSRYTAVTGKSLLSGYQKLGRWALPLFASFTVATMFIISATVVIVTSGLAIQVTGLDWPVMVWNVIVVAIVCGLLLIGRFLWLEKLMKVVIVVLAGTTLLALVFALFSGAQMVPGFMAPTILSTAGITFLLALMGWMPAPMEISVWHSIWATENNHAGHRATKKEAALDFNIGYIGTAVMALVFLSLGALVLYGTGEVFASSAAGFAGQLIDVYARALGDWAWWLIAIAALTTMFSTTLTVFDAYPRVMKTLVGLFEKREPMQRDYVLWLLTTAMGALIILSMLGANMKALVTFATVMSFLTGPLFAFLNYRVVQHLPPSDRPAPWLRWLAITGLVFLVSFSLLYVVWLMGML